jgi:hypothetical protein
MACGTVFKHAMAAGRMAARIRIRRRVRAFENAGCEKPRGARKNCSTWNNFAFVDVSSLNAAG